MGYRAIGLLGYWRLRSVQSPVLRDLAVADERRAAERAQIDVELDVSGEAERRGDAARGFDLARVHLAVPDASARRAPSLRGARAPRPSSNRARPRAARRRRHHTPRASGLQMYLCAWSCSRTRQAGRRGSTSRASPGASTPCTGENSTAPARSLEPVARDDVARVVEVGAIRDDELHLVVRRQLVEVRPVHLRRPRRSPGTSRRRSARPRRARRRSARGRRFRAGRRCPRASSRSHERGARLSAAAARRR